MTIKSIEDLKAANRALGLHWFDRETTNFFGTKIESGILRGRYFISSEQPPHGPRRFTVRSFTDQGEVLTVGKFCGHPTLQAAREAAFAAADARQA